MRALVQFLMKSLLEIHFTYHLGGGVDVGLIRNCNISVKIKFDRVLMDMYNLICYSESEDKLPIESQDVGYLETI